MNVCLQKNADTLRMIASYQNEAFAAQLWGDQNWMEQACASIDTLVTEIKTE